MFAARDPVLCDAWAAAQMGYAPGDIPYIGLAEKLGAGSADLGHARVRELNSGSAGTRAAPSGKVRRLAAHIAEDRACSACYASLVFALSRMEQPERGGLKEKIAVGQGFKGKPGAVGTGRCTAGFRASCPGCPPSGADILAFLRRL